MFALIFQISYITRFASFPKVYLQEDPWILRKFVSL